MTTNRQRRGRPPWWAPWASACTVCLLLVVGTSLMGARATPTSLEPLPDAGGGPASPVGAGTSPQAGTSSPAASVRPRPSAAPSVTAIARPSATPQHRRSTPAPTRVLGSRDGQERGIRMPGGSTRDMEPTTGGRDGSGRHQPEQDRPGSPTDAPAPEPPVDTPPETSPDSGVVIDYRTRTTWPGGFSASVTITNTGARTVDDWAVLLRYSDVEIEESWGARADDEDGDVILRGASWSETIHPGESVSAGFTASGRDPAPSGCAWNGGGPCRLQ